MPARKVLTEAWTAFENLFEEDVTRIANGHGSVHLVRVNKESDHVLPIKIEAEREGGFASWAQFVYSGVVVRYFQNGDTMLCASNETLSNRVRCLRRDNADRLVSPETLKKQILQTVENDQTLLMERRTAQYRHARGAERFALEALGQSELMNTITKGCYKVTPEFCPADAAYAPDTQSFSAECLPIQVKTANVSKAKKLQHTYNFSSTSGYTGMLLLCRLMHTGQAATLALPGNMAPKAIGYKHLEGSKWWPFMVKDRDLEGLLDRVFSALQTGEQDVVWPSGVVVDVTSIKIQPFDDLMVPKQRYHKKEHEARKGFLRRFPSLSVTYPAVQVSQVDCILQGVQVQEKCALSCRHRKDRFSVVLTRSFRSLDGKASRGPYCFEDFQALLAHCPDGKRIFLIPAIVLARYGVMKTKFHDGTSQLLCHADSPEPGEKSKDAWTSQYLYDADDAGCEERLRTALARIKNESRVVPEIHVHTASSEKEAPLSALRRAYKSIPFEEKPVGEEQFTTRIGNSRILIRRGYCMKTGGKTDSFPRYRVQLGVHCQRSRKWMHRTDRDFDVLIVYTALHLFVIDAETMAQHNLLITDSGSSGKKVFFSYYDAPTDTDSNVDSWTVNYKCDRHSPDTETYLRRALGLAI